MRALWLVALMVTTPAMAADQFDLVCVAKSTTVRYRVDLAKGEWCQADCAGTVKIVSATTGLLTLADRTGASPSDLQISTIINRVTGDYYHSVGGGRSMPIERRGHCEAAPFSGFPSSKF